MKQRKLTFQQIVARLEAAKIPCTVKRYGYDNDVRYSIEFGFNWPEELVHDVDRAFEAYGEKVPDYIGLCGSSFSDDMTAKKTIAGGPGNYIGLPRWK